MTRFMAFVFGCSFLGILLSCGLPTSNQVENCVEAVTIAKEVAAQCSDTIQGEVLGRINCNDYVEEECGDIEWETFWHYFDDATCDGELFSYGAETAPAKPKDC